MRKFGYSKDSKAEGAAREMGEQISASRTNLIILGYGAVGNNNNTNSRDSKDRTSDLALGRGLMDSWCS